MATEKTYGESPVKTAQRNLGLIMTVPVGTTWVQEAEEWLSDFLDSLPDKDSTDGG